MGDWDIATNTGFTRRILFVTSGVAAVAVSAADEPALPPVGSRPPHPHHSE